jgi:hypothetical protein
MDSYFYLLPSEINGLILQYLSITDLEHFISIHKYLIKDINWSNVYYLHFKYYKNNIYILNIIKIILIMKNI